MKKKNTLLVGRGTIAVNCLDALHDMEEPPTVVICDSHDDGVDSWTKSLYKRAKELGYELDKNLFLESRVNKPEFIEKLKNVVPDLDIIFSIQPRAIFRVPFISLAKDYVVNLHFAPLPKLRGVAPCSWAFADGLDTMGVTLHLIEDEGVDNGPMIFQKLFPIEEDDTAWTLFHKCVENGTELFKKHAKDILTNNVKPEPQEESKVTYHPMNEFDYSKQELTTDMTVDEALRFTRARIFPVMQLPYVMIDGKKVSIHGIKKSKGNSNNRNTHIVKLKDGAVEVTTN